MDRRLAEGLLKTSNKYIYALVGFDECEDFIKIMKINKVFGQI